MNKYISFVKKLVFFALFSAIGLSLDIGFYLVLIKYGVNVFISSLISSLSAVSFVFVFSGVWVFRKRGLNSYKYIFWILYQFCNILFFSAIVNYLYLNGLSPLSSKLLIVPITFFCNFLVMSILSKTKSS